MALCPECKSSVDLGPVWNQVPLDRLGCPKLRVGVQCPACSTKLEVVTRRSASAIVRLQVAGAVLSILCITLFAYANPLIALLAPVPLIYLLAGQKQIAQRFATLIGHDGQDTIEFPVDKRQLKIEQDPWKRDSKS